MGGVGGCGRKGNRILGGNSKSFMGKGKEEIADWTLGVSSYFYCPKSPFLALSGLLGSSKKCSLYHSSPKEMSRSLSRSGGKTCCLKKSTALFLQPQRSVGSHPPLVPNSHLSHATLTKIIWMYMRVC